MSTTTIDGNYSIILPVMKQGREENRKEEKNKKQEESLLQSFLRTQTKRRKNILFYKFYKGFCSCVFSVKND